MVDDYSGLECILEEEDIREQGMEHELLLEEIPAEDFEDAYLIRPEILEIQEAVREVQETPPEGPEDIYEREAKLSEVRNAIYWERS